jgi:hypothetical protein
MAFTSWVVYVFTVMAFVGFFSGVILAMLWAVRWALGLEATDDRHAGVKSAVIGFGLAVLGLLAGGLLVIAVMAGPFLAVVATTQALYGDYPPAWFASGSLGLLVAIAWMAAAWFARHWQRVIRARLASVNS